MKLLLTIIGFTFLNLTYAQLELGCNSTDSINFSCFPGQNSPANPDSLLHLPSTHTFQIILSQGDTLSNGTSTAGTYNDLAAFIPINGSSTHGYLSVNHESAPQGKVSLLEIKYDSISRMWVTIESRSVNFNVPNLYAISRPCSGNITSWGTVIVGEEQINYTIDSNGDGYHDYGWLVEIDPVTGEVLDYENDGIKDKLWAMGKMAHENIAFANDSVAYFGCDQSTGYLYKFVADSVTNFSSGSLYVLNLGGLAALVSSTSTVPDTGIWIPVPNSTITERNDCISNSTVLGATNFRYVEDVEINPLTGEIYFAASSIDAKAGLYKFQDQGDSISNFKIVLDYTYNYSIEHSFGIQTVQLSDGIDNLAFDELGNLFVLQDGDNNSVWFLAADHEHQTNEKISLFIQTPFGCEPTGLTFTPDNRFGFMSIQHPLGDTLQLDEFGDTVYWNISQTFVVSRTEFLGKTASQHLLFTESLDTVHYGDTIYFTNVPIGNSFDKWVTIGNQGTENIVIDYIVPVNHPFIQLGSSLPYILHPDSSQNMLLNFSPTSVGTYYAQYSVISNDSINPFIFYVEATSIDDSGLENNSICPLRLYPNPFKDKINYESTENGVLYIMDGRGRKIQELFITKNNESIETSFMDTGIYFIIFETENNSYIIKMIKE